MRSLEKEVDKGSLEPDTLIEIYSDLGLNLIHNKKPYERTDILEEKYGDIRNELLYLQSTGDISVDGEIEEISLRPMKRDIARKIADRVHNQRKIPAEVAEMSWIPDYLSSPDIIEEDYREETELLDQRPDEEVPTRIFEILDAEKPLTSSDVEEKFSAEINFQLEPWMKYLETQGVVEKVESERYRLVEENISEKFFGTKLNAEGRIKDQERYGNDPWKP